MTDSKRSGKALHAELIASMDATCAEALRIADKHVCSSIGSSYIPAAGNIGAYARAVLDALLSEREGGGV